MKVPKIIPLFFICFWGGPALTGLPSFNNPALAQDTAERDSKREENELFLIAQKAFDDAFYDVAVGYLTQFIEKYPQSEKYTKAKLLLGQCFYFKAQYLKAFDVFQALLSSDEVKDAV